MILTARDKKALEETCDCIHNCRRYHTQPAAWFPLLLRMYRELEDAGMIEWDEEAGLEESPGY